MPARGRVSDFLQEDHSLPANCVYVGRGHHTHRLATTCWASPVVPGHDCSAEEWIARYVEHICSQQHLWQALPSLCDKTLVCDCPSTDLCEVDLLAGLVFEATAPPHELSSSRKRGTHLANQRAGSFVKAIAASRVVTVSSCPSPPVWLSQESITLAVKKLFPATWFTNFAFCMVEDLLNQPPFTCYPQWRSEQGLEWDGALNPDIAAGPVRLAWRMAEGKQAGAHSQKAALSPLVSFGLDPDTHFQAALKRARDPVPTEAPPVLDADLRFAGACNAHWRGDLRDKRKRALGVLQELKYRLQSVSKVLVSHQSQAIQAVTKSRDLGLLAVLMVITSWGDTGYPFGLIKGLPAVGYAPHYGIFPLQPSERITMADLLQGWQSHNSQILQTIRPGKDDAFALSQSLADADQGFCTPPLKRADFLHAIKNQPHRLIPRCVITQSSGKQRVIDNADSGGQSALSSDSNKLVLCSPLWVAQHIAVTVRQMTPEALALAGSTIAWETGGEDWPNAYRHSPMSFEESMGCVVVWWHEEWNEPAYQIYTGLLFGLPLAVTSFNRYSRFAEALGRRLLYVLVSLYFDDASLTDWKSSKGSGQFAFGKLNGLLGTPFAAEKRQPMASEGLFLGLDHDVSQAMSHGIVTFWARERLEAKLLDLIQTSRQSNRLPGGVAAKLYGVANFFEQGIYGRVGCGGLAAIKERQYEKGTALTPEISDAALESPGQGTGGFLIIWLDQDSSLREAFVADIPSSIYSLWSPGDKKIAQLELIMVLYGLITRPHQFRHRRGIWFIDNTAALMALIRGRSDSRDLEHMSQMIHVALYALDCWIYWEWIPSKSNWSDSISRLGYEDPWSRANHFRLYTAFFPQILWALPFLALIHIFEFM